jgi:1-acyl-sn-glycerol-3-phosphate acyltransferase
MFPEGGFRRGDRSILRSGRLVPGVGRIASLARAPIVPAVIVNSIAYSRPLSWFPFRVTRYGVAFGSPISPDLPAEESESRLVCALRALEADLALRLPERCRAI